MDCIPDETGTRCRNCGWEWKRPSPFPHRNCPNAPSRGLGDTIAKMTALFGVKPCGGCKKRQKKLNDWWPYHTVQSHPVDDSSPENESG